MKKLLFPIFMLVLIVSCSKDPMEELEGTWQLVRVEGESTVTGETSSAPASGNFTFNADGTGSLSWNFDVAGVNSSASGNFEWSATETTLTISDSSGPLVFDREENKRNRQVISYEEDFQLDRLRLRFTLEK